MARVRVLKIELRFENEIRVFRESLDFEIVMRVSQKSSVITMYASKLLAKLANKLPTAYREGFLSTLPMSTLQNLQFKSNTTESAVNTSFVFLQL